MTEQRGLGFEGVGGLGPLTLEVEESLPCVSMSQYRWVLPDPPTRPRVGSLYIVHSVATGMRAHMICVEIENGNPVCLEYGRI